MRNLVHGSRKRANPYVTPPQTVKKRRNTNYLGYAGAAAGYYMGGPAGAMTGYKAGTVMAPWVRSAGKVARKLFRNRRRNQWKQNLKMGPGSKKWAGTSTGRTAAKGGRFKRPRKSKQPRVETMLLKKGYHRTEETFGRLEDPHCGYIIHSTHNPTAYSQVISGGLIRKIFEKAGIPMNSRSQELPLFNVSNSDGFRLQYVFQDPVNGSLATHEYITVDNQGITEVINAFSLMSGHIFNYLTDVTDFEPYMLLLQVSDRNGLDTNWRTTASLNLQNVNIYLHSQSNCKVQNRSAADNPATGDKYDANRVDNVPLKGYLYEFRHGEPRLKFVRDAVTAGTDVALNRIPSNGISLIRAGEIVSDLQFQEPPVPKTFANLSKHSYVGLEPGDIKSMFVKHEFKGTLVNILKKMKVSHFATPNMSGVPGKCQILALEEKIRTDTTNPITVQYERQQKIGCFFTEKRPAPFNTVLTTTNLNNLP